MPRQVRRRAKLGLDDNQINDKTEKGQVPDSVMTLVNDIGVQEMRGSGYF